MAEMKAFEKTKARHGNLEKLYQALLNIAPTSVSCERAFSVSGDLVTSGRNRLKDSSINALCFLKGYFSQHTLHKVYLNTIQKYTDDPPTLDHFVLSWTRVELPCFTIKIGKMLLSS